MKLELGLHLQHRLVGLIRPQLHSCSLGAPLLFIFLIILRPNLVHLLGGRGAMLVLHIHSRGIILAIGL